MNGTLKICAVAALCLAVAGVGATSQAALVSFETSEGHSVGDLATGTAVGDVTYSINADYKLVVDALPGTAWPTDSPPPITGENGLKQVVVNGGNRAVLTLELGGAMSGKALDSFNFADRGNMPRRLKVEYFGTAGQSIGHNMYARGDQNNPAWGGEVLGLHGYGQSFQKLSPTAPFQGQALSKIEITSFVNNNELFGYGDSGTPGRMMDGHSVHSTHHATATFEDFSFSDATSSSYEFVGLNFDHPHAGGTPVWGSNQMTEYHDGISMDGHTVAGVASIKNVSPTVDNYAFELDHGYKGLGTGDEPNPIDGDHILYVRTTEDNAGAIKLQLDILNGMGLSEFYFAFRGNGTPTVTAEYFDPSGNSLGSDVKGTADAGGPSFPLTVTEGNGDVVDNYTCGTGSTSPGFGLEGCTWLPRFDRFEVSAAYSGVPMSQVLITIDGPGPSNSSYLDHFRLTPEPGSLVLLGMAGLVALRRRMA